MRLLLSVILYFLIGIGTAAVAVQDDKTLHDDERLWILLLWPVAVILFCLVTAWNALTRLLLWLVKIGPLMVSVDFPKEMATLKALIADSQKGGKGVQHLPKYYVPYAEARTQALGQSQPVQKLLKGDTHFSKQLEKHIAETGRKAADLNYLPLQTRRGWGAVLMDAKTGDMVKLLPPPDL